MQISQDKNKITFVFEKNGLDYDFGKALIDQLSLPNKLVGVKTLKKGSNNIEVSLKDVELLQEILPNLTISQNAKCIYELFYAIYEIETIAILSKSALWCNIENLYYDINASQIKYIILPVTKELEYKDQLSFEECFKESVNYIAGYLPFDYKKTIIEEMDKYFLGNKSIEKVLEAIKALLNEEDSTRILSAKVVQNRSLSLVYFREEATVEYIMEKAELTIGKGDQNVDIDFADSESVSRLHCKLMKQNQLFFIQDLDSVNHTLVNGEIIPPFELMELEDMDIITVGDIDIRVRLQ